MKKNTISFIIVLAYATALLFLISLLACESVTPATTAQPQTRQEQDSPAVIDSDIVATFSLRHKIDDAHIRGAEGLAIYGNFVASGSWDNSIVFTNIVSGERILSIQDAHGSDVVDLEFDERGEFLASVGLDGKIKFWDAEGVLIKELSGFAKNPIDLDLMRTADDVLVAVALLTGELRVYSYNTLALQRSLTQSKDTFSTSVKFLADGKTLAGADGRGGLQLWDIATGLSIAELSGHGSRINALSISPDGSVLASGSRDASVILWDIAQKRRIGVLESAEQAEIGIESVTFTPDGRFLMVGNRNGGIFIWDFRNEKLELLQETDSIRVYDIKVNRDGTAVATVGYDHSIRIYDFATK